MPPPLRRSLCTAALAICVAIFGLALLGPAIFGLAPAAAVVAPEERLDDPGEEARARDLSKGLRCVVCQNQSIDDSNAPLAQDLRRIVRERIEAGDDDDAVIDYVVARYGDYVLLRPPVQPNTYLLWFGPAVVFVLGAVGAVAFVRSRRLRAAGPEAPTLTAEEQARLEALLREETWEDGASDPGAANRDREDRRA